MYEEMLPKIWMGRIQKYWDKIMPSDFPVSGSTFNTKFEDPEVAAEVTKFEAELGTEQSVVNELIPEGTVATKYIGTYDVEATPGELTLLSPEKVTNENIVVLHFVDGVWVEVQDVQIIDGYVWGTLESFSPIAIVEYRKEIHLEETVDGIPKGKAFVVCEGNAVKITEKDDKTVAINIATGKEIELPEKTYIIGGSADGTPIKKTSVCVEGVSSNKYLHKVIGGSAYIGEGFATVDEINVLIKDSAIYGITGSFGAVRTMKFNFTANHAKLYFLGCGECYAKVDNPVPTFADRGWIKDVNYNIDDLECEILYCGGNNEYYYVDNTVAVLNNSKIPYLTCGGSNGATKDSFLTMNNCDILSFQSSNRGQVAIAKAVFNDCKVDGLYVGGDSTDSTVTGTTDMIKIDVNKGTYNLVVGTNGGNKLTAEDVANIVDSVKVSRSADITITDDDKVLLGDKLVIK